jgi:hypothetical protein
MITFMYLDEGCWIVACLRMCATLYSETPQDPMTRPSGLIPFSHHSKVLVIFILVQNPLKNFGIFRNSQNCRLKVLDKMVLVIHGFHCICFKGACPEVCQYAIAHTLWRPSSSFSAISASKVDYHGSPFDSVFYEDTPA